MRKRIIGAVEERRPDASGDWLDLEQLVTVEVSSEDAAHPIESALLPARDGGWRASGPGPQLVRLRFLRPQTLTRIRVEFEDAESTRTQEYLLRWSADDGRSYADIVRQMWNFSPAGSTRQVEQHRVALPDVTVLELRIVPDTSGGEAVASMAALRVA